MREIGTLIWVLFVVVGVVSSIVSSIRKRGTPSPMSRAQAYGRASTGLGVPRPPAQSPEPVAVVPVAVKPARRPAEAPVPVMSEHRAARPRLFARPADLVGAVIAAEVFGKPLGLRDEPFVR